MSMNHAHSSRPTTIIPGFRALFVLAALAALAAYGVWRYVLHRPIAATTPLPFGLFLAPAIWAGWLAEAILAFYQF